MQLWEKDLVIQETWPKTKGLYVLEGGDNTVFRPGHLYVMSGLPIRQLSKPTCAAGGKKTWAVALWSSARSASVKLFVFNSLQMRDWFSHEHDGSNKCLLGTK